MMSLAEITRPTDPELLQMTMPEPPLVGPQARLMVLAFATCDLYDRLYDKVLLVRKPSTSKFHPLWLNLPGGHVEKHELPAHAAVRELKEETGLDGTFPQYMGCIRPPREETDTPQDFVVFVYRLLVDSKQPLKPEPNQPAYWLGLHGLSNALTENPTLKLVPNLTVLLPLLVVGLQKNWVLTEGANTVFEDDITASYRLLTPNASYRDTANNAK